MYKPTIAHLEKYENIVKHELFDYDVFTTVDMMLDGRKAHQVARVNYDTLNSILYHLESIHIYMPPRIAVAKDDVLLFATLGQKEQDTLMYTTLKRALQRLRVYIGDGAYYLYLDTKLKSASASAKDVYVYAIHERVDGLETRVALAGIERPWIYSRDAQRARLEALR